MNDWKSFSENKPKDGDECVAFNGEIMQSAYYSSSDDSWFADYFGTIRGVTHWFKPETPL